MRLLSVNVGQPRVNPWKTVKLTGIDKRPVTGPVMVTAPRPGEPGMVGLAGDRVYDVHNHGGPDQAVYAYARENLDFWAAELGRAFYRPGHEVTVALTFRALATEPELLPGLLAADALPEDVKELASRRIV